MALKTFAAGDVLTASDTNTYLVNAVIQAQNDPATSRVVFTTTSFADMTGLSVTITPKATTSKILVICSGLVSVATSGATTRLNLVRDSTNIAQSTSSATADQSFAFTASAANDSAGFSIMWLDSPASVSSLTYKLQGAVTSGSGAVGGYAGITSYYSSTNITVIEIQQ
jgi:hypothetical protein